MAQRCRWLAVSFLMASIVVLPAFSGHASLLAQTPARSASGAPAGSSAGASPGTSTGASTGTADYSTEPFVVESILHKVTFENDGRSVDETTLRVRIQSTTGVQQFGVVRVPYASASGDAQIVYARVVKPNGSVVATSSESILDMPASITQEAPFYSDLKEKQLAIKGMEIGDVLEYQTRVTETAPLVPGQFWFTDDFRANTVLLQQTLQVIVPAGRYINLKSPRHQPVITEAKGRRTYTWSIPYAAPAASAAPDSAAAALARATPDVQLSTFHTWDEVAQWYRKLQETRVVPSPEVRAKEAELTKGITSDSEKIRVLYSYVATKYRYIGIAFGIGRYQPHAAAEVLSNGYGDCKDKHTLLASLLAAANIKAYPALLNSEARMDPDVPAPSQFDHVVTVVPQDGPQGKDLLWLDSTTEVAPAGYLSANLRDIQALIIPDSGAAKLVQTPAGPPFDTIYDFSLDGKMNDQGTLQASVDVSVRGDTEFLLRSALHRSAQQDWGDLIQGFSQRGSMPGTVNNVTVSSPEDTEKPLKIAYSYTGAGENGWSGKPLAPPMPRLNVPNLPALVAGASGQDAAAPITLQFPGEYFFRDNIVLPPGFQPKLPESVSVQQDFAQYTASYSIENGVFHAERHLIIHQHEIPQSRRQDYLALRKAVNDDMQTSAALSSVPGNAPAGAAPSIAPRLVADARTAMYSGNMSGALTSLQAATSADPTSAEAWSLLGYVHALRGNPDQGIGEMWKAVGLAPREWWAYRELADMLAYLHRYPEELQALQQAMVITPNDAAVTWRSAQALLAMQRPGDAIAQLLPAVEKTPMDSRLALMLGRAYIRQGNQEKAIGAFQKALQFAFTSANLNSVAKELADGNFRLDDALHYAQQSVAMEEDTTTKTISLSTARAADMVEMIRLGQAWDTAGWAHFRLGDTADAEKYFMSAWKLAQNPAAGDHLGQLYEKQGNTHDAARFYALAMAAGNAPDDTAARLASLLGGKAQADLAVVAASTELDKMRTATLPRLVKGPAKAQVYVQFAQPANAPVASSSASIPASAVHFVAGGNEELAAASDAIAAAHYDIEFPDGHAVTLVRQGNITCDESSPTCQIVFLAINMINSIN